MSKFRMKTDVVDAYLWCKNGDHPDDYKEVQVGFENGELREFSGEERRKNGWEGNIVRYFRHPDIPGEDLCKKCRREMQDHGWIDTSKGGHIVCPGDWIITGIKGKYYPCKPDVFYATYVPSCDESSLDDYEPMPSPNKQTVKATVSAIRRHVPNPPDIDGDVDISRASIAREFFEECDRRAGEKMLKTGVMTGAHYAAMQQVLGEWEDAKKEREILSIDEDGL